MFGYCVERLLDSTGASYTMNFSSSPLLFGNETITYDLKFGTPLRGALLSWFFNTSTSNSKEL